MVQGRAGALQRRVAIIGVGATPFCNIDLDPEMKGLTEGEFFGTAALQAMEDAGLEPRDVEFFYHGSANPKFFNNAATPNMQVAEWFGMRGKGVEQFRPVRFGESRRRQVEPEEVAG